MHLVNPRENSKATLDSMFAAKYPWLLRWAMHFVQNDRAAAEDLVQDTFLRILSLHDEVSNLDDIEPLLYTHLRFAFLTERRRGLSQTFLGLGTIDFDTFAASLRTPVSTKFDQIEAQNELRKILAFLLWRRRSAKFASIFLLRFFHGFSPEEIAPICLISRHSVDLALGYAREELKTYLVNPSKLHVLRRGSVPEYKPFNIAIPSCDFEKDLLQSIFNSSCGTCPSSAFFERHYHTLNLRPLESDLLAHIVSCKVCLYKVTQFLWGTAATHSFNGGLFETNPSYGKIKAARFVGERCLCANLRRRARKKARNIRASPLGVGHRAKRRGCRGAKHWFPLRNS
jgi:RNA polymerase sigma factor (sigma-70 family)